MKVVFGATPYRKLAEQIVRDATQDGPLMPAAQFFYPTTGHIDDDKYMLSMAMDAERVDPEELLAHMERGQTAQAFLQEVTGNWRDPEKSGWRNQVNVTLAQRPTGGRSKWKTIGEAAFRIRDDQGRLLPMDTLRELLRDTIERVKQALKDEKPKRKETAAKV